MVNFYTLESANTIEWNSVLQRCYKHDVYHLPEYHQLAEEQGEGKAVLLVYEKNDGIIAIPFLVRKIENIPGFPYSEYRDVTSVYGYPGPISNIKNLSEDIKNDFYQIIINYFKENKIVSAFSRLNPLFDHDAYLSGGGGRIVKLNQTVAINLKLDLELQYQQYKKNLKRDINKLKQQDLDIICDYSWNYFEEFIDIYYQTMQRNDANQNYFFTKKYFNSLGNLLKEKIYLFIVLKENRVISGALFTLCDSIIQYHLAGTHSKFLHISPSKIILDQVRQWGTEKRADVLHLGGGLGSREDSLFRFKAGFSKERYSFKVWRMIVDKEVYNTLTAQKQDWNKANNLKELDDEYFPMYRCPTKLL